MQHLSRGELERRFAHHPPPDQERVEKHEAVRAILLDAADRLVSVTGGPTPEQTLMIRQLEVAMFWGNAAVARPPGNGAP